MKPSEQNQGMAKSANAEPKRAYVTPELTELGRIEDLTRGFSGVSDDGQPFRRKS